MNERVERVQDPVRRGATGGRDPDPVAILPITKRHTADTVAAVITQGFDRIGRPCCGGGGQAADAVRFGRRLARGRSRPEKQSGSRDRKIRHGGVRSTRSGSPSALSESASGGSVAASCSFRSNPSAGEAAEGGSRREALDPLAEISTLPGFKESSESSRWRGLDDRGNCGPCSAGLAVCSKSTAKRCPASRRRCCRWE